MIKLVMVGAWACAVSLGACYAVTSGLIRSTPKSGQDRLFGRLEHVKTKSISVPIIDHGSIEGYVIAQFVFAIDAQVLKRLSVKPDVFLLDEAFRTIYAGSQIKFTDIKKHDLDALKKTIGDNVNKRLGMPIIEDVLIEELNYVPKDQVRGGPKRKEPPG